MFKLLKPQLILNTTNLLARNYASKKEFCKQMNWTRPVKIPSIFPEKSGDLKPFPDVNTKEFMLEFKNSKELQTADDVVKDLFRLENNRRKKTVEYAEREMIDTVKRHQLDFGSMESLLASKTLRIRSLQQYVMQYPRNKKAKVHLKELIDRRKRFLRYLRRWDYKRFEWILEKLDIVYKPYPSKYHLIERKASIRKLAYTHCENIKNERLEAYRRILESQQVDFLEKKIKNLEFIREEQIACNLPVTITQEEIDAVIKQHEVLRKSRQSTEVVKGRKQRVAIN